MNRRLSLVLIPAIGGALISLVLVGVMAVLTSTNLGNVSLSNMLLGDTVVLMFALIVFYVRARNRPLVIIPDRVQSGVEVSVQVASKVASEENRRRVGRKVLGLPLWLFVLIVIALTFLLPYVILPAIGLGVGLPTISVPGEVVNPNIPWLTNTFIGLLIADVLVFLFIFLAASKLREVPGRLQAIVEMIVELFAGQAQQMVGAKWRSILPLALTIFILLLFANWLELVPGVDSIGTMHCPDVGQNGYPTIGVSLSSNKPLNTGTPATQQDVDACNTLANGGTLTADQQQRAALTAKLDSGTLSDADKAVVSSPSFQPLRPNLRVVTSVVRAGATDLNLTVMLAIVAFLTTEFYGIREYGARYFTKFINVPAMRRIGSSKETMGRKAFAGIDIFVGIIEAVSELARLLSYSFRLFGNIFAGQALLFVFGFLIGAIVPVAVYFLEMFVGAIQAVVFALLLLIFTGLALVPPHAAEEHEEELAIEAAHEAPAHAEA